MTNDNATLGKASLWSAIIGVVLPGCFAILVAIFLNSPVLGQDPGPAYALCVILLTTLELVALGCGIAARRTATGMAGLVISGILLPFPVIVLVLTLMPAGVMPRGP